jgi:hypothetical protein
VVGRGDQAVRGDERPRAMVEIDHRPQGGTREIGHGGGFLGDTQPAELGRQLRHLLGAPHAFAGGGLKREREQDGHGASRALGRRLPAHPRTISAPRCTGVGGRRPMAHGPRGPRRTTVNATSFGLSRRRSPRSVLRSFRRAGGQRTARNGR